MSHSNKINQNKYSVQRPLKGLLILSILAVLVGSLVASFLWLLDQVTQLRWHNGWLLYLLPLAGLLIYWLYAFWGKRAAAGNNLIIDAIHEQEQEVPTSIVPLVLFTTLLTHAFGGSAGREGTAVQMGGGLAAFLGRRFGLNHEEGRILLMAGMAAGFGAVFGTPLAGAFFAVEVIAIGSIQFKAFVPCLMASFMAHWACLAWGVEHTVYRIGLSGNGLDGIFHFDLLLMGKTLVAAIGFGFAAFLFAEMHLQIKHLFTKLVTVSWLVPLLGGIMVIGLSYLLNTQDYLGLGVNSQDTYGVSIVNAFKENAVSHFSWFWKILFTAITLGSGFKGGEVTPLFFIGACLGNTLAWLTGAPTDLFAALGFISVFAGATNTFIASSIMGCELFGTDFALYFMVACFIARFTSGYSSIYPSQRMGDTGKKVVEHPTYSLKKIWGHLKGK